MEVKKIKNQTEVTFTYNDDDEIGIPYAMCCDTTEKGDKRAAVAINHKELYKLCKKANIKCDKDNCFSSGSKVSTIRIKVSDIVKLLNGDQIVNDFFEEND